MSYGVSIRLPVKGLEDRYVQVADLGNITWNVRELIKKSSGWEIQNEDNNGAVLPWLSLIRNGYCQLTAHPEAYKRYESPNGWGTVGGTKRFYEDCIKNAEDWMRCNEDLLPVAVVWVD